MSLIKNVSLDSAHSTTSRNTHVQSMLLVGLALCRRNVRCPRSAATTLPPHKARSEAPLPMLYAHFMAQHTCLARWHCWFDTVFLILGRPHRSDVIDWWACFGMFWRFVKKLVLHWSIISTYQNLSVIKARIFNEKNDTDYWNFLFSILIVLKKKNI